MKGIDARLILISVLPGSGKSTCGRWVSEFYKTAYIDYDTIVQRFMGDIYRKFYEELPYDEFCVTWRKCCYQTFWDVIAENLKNGVCVTASAPLTKERQQQDFFRRLRGSYNLECNILSISMEVPEKILYTRMKDRQSPRDRQKIKDWDRYYRAQSQKTAWDPDLQLIYQEEQEYKRDRKIGEFLNRQNI